MTGAPLSYGPEIVLPGVLAVRASYSPESPCPARESITGIRVVLGILLLILGLCSGYYC